MTDHVEIPLTRGLVALVDDEDAERVLAAGSWYARSGGSTFYAERNAPTRAGRRGRLGLHKFLTGFDLTDHINGNGLDNRRANLRQATHAENSRNRRRARNNTSGFKGVSFHKGKSKWHASMRRQHLGYFRTPEVAAIAYDLAVREAYGEFANPNFPDLAAIDPELIRQAAEPETTPLPTACANGHEYTPENTYFERGEVRRCRTCRTENTRRLREQTAYSACPACGVAMRRDSIRRHVKNQHPTTKEATR